MDFRSFALFPSPFPRSPYLYGYRPTIFALNISVFYALFLILTHYLVCKHGCGRCSRERCLELSSLGDFYECICEIQQSSNNTYRLYDYGRVDKFGTPRELHLEKALDVLNYEKYTLAGKNATPGVGGELLAQCKYFETLDYCVDGTQKLQLDSKGGVT